MPTGYGVTPQRAWTKKSPGTAASSRYNTAWFQLLFSPASMASGSGGGRVVDACLLAQWATL
eukprot:11161755-Alexandrium_andersonii.AAC.1